MEMTEAERRAALCEELGISNEDLSLIIGSKRQDKKDRWRYRNQKGPDDYLLS